MINSLVLDGSAYHAGYPDQCDKPRRGPRGTPQGTVPRGTLKGIIADVNNSLWGNVQNDFNEVTHIEVPAELVRAARAEEIEYFNKLLVWDVVKIQDKTSTSFSFFYQPSSGRAPATRGYRGLAPHGEL